MINEKELKELLKIKDQYLHNCKICNGSGIIPEKNQKDTNWVNAKTCDCIKKFRVIKKLYLTNIPRPYWGSSINDILEKQNRVKIKKYIEKIDYCINNNLGLFLSGGGSTGKSLMLNVVLKKLVLEKNIECRYTSLVSILNFEETNIEELRKYDIIAIDGIGEEYQKDGSDYVIKTLIGILRDRIRDNKLTLIASKLSLEKINIRYGKDISKLIKDNFMQLEIIDNIKKTSGIKLKIQNLLR